MVIKMVGLVSGEKLISEIEFHGEEWMFRTPSTFSMDGNEEALVSFSPLFPLMSNENIFIKRSNILWEVTPNPYIQTAYRSYLDKMLKNNKEDLNQIHIRNEEKRNKLH